MAILRAPFDQFGATAGGHAQAGADGHLHAFATALFAGVESTSAIVGHSFAVTPTSGSGFGPFPPLFPQPFRVITATVTLFVQHSSDSFAAFGGFAAGATVELVMLRGSSINPIGRQRLELERSVSPILWGASHIGSDRVTLSISAINVATGPETWSVGVRLGATASGVGAGEASANIFTDVSSIITNT